MWTVGERECSVLTSTQYQFHSELVEDSSWARGLDENLMFSLCQTLLVISMGKIG